MDLERATDVFCAGFTYTRSFTHPFEVVRINGLRVMRDAPRKKGEYRVQEVIAVDADPEGTVAAIRAYAPERFVLCAIQSMDRPEAPIKEAYKRHAFRLLHREPMMVRELEGVQSLLGPLPIVRVTESGLASKIAERSGRQILDHDLHDGDAELRLYAAMQGDEPIGWVRSIRTEADCTWVSNMYVHHEYRRQGIGRSLMSEMLVDDAKYGAKWSVLLASTAGSKLYPIVGYRQIGLLQLFAPKKDVWGGQSRSLK